MRERCREGNFLGKKRKDASFCVWRLSRVEGPDLSLKNVTQGNELPYQRIKEKKFEISL